MADTGLVINGQSGGTSATPPSGSVTAAQKQAQQVTQTRLTNLTVWLIVLTIVLILVLVLAIVALVYAKMPGPIGPQGPDGPEGPAGPSNPTATNFCYLTNNTGIVVPTGVSKTLTWDTTVDQEGITYSNGVFTCPLAGVYAVAWNIEWQINPVVTYGADGWALGSFDGQLRGISPLVPSPNLTNAPYLQVSTQVYLPTAGGTIQCQVFQSSGGPVTVSSGANRNSVLIQLVSAF